MFYQKRRRKINRNIRGAARFVFVERERNRDGRKILLKKKNALFCFGSMTVYDISLRAIIEITKQFFRIFLYTLNVRHEKRKL